MLLEEVEGKLGAVLPNLVHKVFKGLHPELVDRGNQLHSRALHFLAVVYHIFSPILKLMEKLGFVLHHGKVVEVFVECMGDGFVDVDTLQHFVVDFLYLFLQRNNHIL